MSLNIMIAGVSKDERERVEASVRAAFNGRPDTEPWNVSLVNVASQWSIDIDGPEPQFKGLSLVSSYQELTASLQQIITEAGAATAETPPSNGSAPEAATTTTPAGESQNQHTCESCAANFAVHFDSLEGEPVELCPVACPACWHVNKVPIAEAAGATGDYRAEIV